MRPVREAMVAEPLDTLARLGEPVAGVADRVGLDDLPEVALPPIVPEAEMRPVREAMVAEPLDTLAELGQPVAGAAGGVDLPSSPEAVLERCGKEINWFTGTSSATLIGAAACVSKLGEPALVPTGLLLEMGIVPLTGELGGGIIDNLSAVNHLHLSGVGWHYVKVASTYARSASTHFAIDTATEWGWIESFIEYGKQRKRTEIALRRLSLYPTPEGVDRQKTAQELENRVKDPELPENWQNYLGWIGAEIPTTLETKPCNGPLHLSQLVVVGRSRGISCYGVVMAVSRCGADEEVTIMVESQPQAYKIYRNEQLSNILLPDTYPEEKRLSDEVQKEISSLIFLARGFREAIETFKNPQLEKEDDPFISHSFPIVIGAEIGLQRLTRVQSAFKELGVRGKVSFPNEVRVIFAPEDKHAQVAQWLKVHNLSIPLLSLSHVSS